MNDDTLAHLFSRLPKACIVLLEDIDACGVTRDSSDDDLKSSSPPAASKAIGVATAPGDGTHPPTRVTFSGLLNAIDGVASKEGRLLIMTTNHRDRLDEALIRPGRVDMQIKFNFADRAIIHSLFKTLYTVDLQDKEVLKFPRNFPDDDELENLATKFSEKVPEGLFSPAEVQSLLLRFKKEPRKAVEVVEDWIFQKKTEKSSKECSETESAVTLEPEKAKPVVKGLKDEGALVVNVTEKGVPSMNGAKEDEIPV
jgi:chaperone BCS1